MKEKIPSNFSVKNEKNSKIFGKTNKKIIFFKVYIKIINKVTKMCGLFSKMWYNRMVRIDNLGALHPNIKT